MKIGVVGLGLMGGSYIKAFKKLKFEAVYGFDLDHTIVEAAYCNELINNSTNDYELLKDVDVLFICLYPHTSLEFIRDYQHLLKTGCILTDIIGLKNEFILSLNKIIRKDIFFIGGHPMAGKEGIGFDASDSSIFLNANYILMESDVPKAKYEVLESIVKNIGCHHIEKMTPKVHDEMIAYTSHMPHILSTIFMNSQRKERVAYCVAGSFRDMTRVSEINVDLWSELILDNRHCVLDELVHFKNQLEKIEEAIKVKDETSLRVFLKDARTKKIQLNI